MKIIRWLLWLLPALVVPGGLTLAAQQLPAAPTAYSATMVMHSQGHTVTERIDRNQNRIRTAMQMPGRPGAGMYNLVLLDQHKTYMVMPQNHMCMAMPLNSKFNIATLQQQMQHSISVTDLGPGHANGHPADVKQVVYTDAQGHRLTSKIWLATDLKNLPVRMQGRDAQGHAYRIDFTHVSLTPPPASRFAPPAHCRGFMGMPHP